MKNKEHAGVRKKTRTIRDKLITINRKNTEIATTKLQDTQDRQHPLLVTAPIQPKKEIMNRITPIPMNIQMNLQNINQLV